MNLRHSLVVAVTVMHLLVHLASACTNLIVTKGASEDGSTIYSYAADSAGLYGSIDRYAAQKGVPKGTMRKIYDWDSGVYLGEIPEASETYDVVGNMNEFQLTIGETTFGGLPELCKKRSDALIDYGTLIVLGLQRAKTAREAVSVMTELVERYGYTDGSLLGFLSVLLDTARELLVNAGRRSWGQWQGARCLSLVSRFSDAIVAQNTPFFRKFEQVRLGGRVFHAG